MTDILSPSPIQRFADSNGVALAGGQLFTYAAGTTTKINVFTDAGGSTPFENPIILNSRGEPASGSQSSLGIWLLSGVGYKYVLSPATDTDPPTNPIWSIDNVSAGSSGTGPQFIIDTGTVNALAVALTPVPSGYVAGMAFVVQVANTTTGATTINVNGLGAKAVVFYGPLASGALLANNVYLMVYDSAGHFEVLSVPGQSGWVVNGFLANMPAGTVKGNNTGSPAPPQDIPTSTITGGFRPGEYRTFATVAAVPSNCLLCDGTSYPTATYPNLFAAIGYAFGGSGASFNVPDFATSGAFMRALNTHIGGPAPSAAIGTLQTDAMQGHFHGPASGAVAYILQVVHGSESTEAGTNATFDGEFSGTGPPITDGVNGTPRTAAETRPSNFSVVVAIQT